jgi:hypothetical protein
MWPGHSSTAKGCSEPSSCRHIMSPQLEFVFSAHRACCRSIPTSSSMPTELASNSAACLEILRAARGLQTASKPLWTHRRTSQWCTPLITMDPGAPEPRTGAMVIQTVQLAPRVARPVRMDPASVEVLQSVDHLAGVIPSHCQAVARAGMTVGPLSIQLAGGILTTKPTAMHKPANLKIRFHHPGQSSTPSKI